jgi:type II secretory pathway pseudopilin PulG
LAAKMTDLSHDRFASAGGWTVVEILFVLAIVISLATFAVPLSTSAVDDFRSATAARYVAGRIMDARMKAVSRSAHVALRFERDGDDYMFATYIDGNNNGVRTGDVHSGVDRRLGPPERLDHQFPGTRFELAAGVPDVDGWRGSTEGVRIGAARILTTSADGTATSGTLYIRGRRGQYAVRVLGATGRTRVLRYDMRTSRWVSQ